MTRRSAQQDPWRWTAAALAVTIAAAHIPVTGPHLDEAPYIGWLFVALEVATAVLAVVLVLRGDRPTWWAAAVVAVAAMGAYVLTRTVALPQMADDTGNWFEPLGVVALGSEVLLLALALARGSGVLPARRSVGHPVAAGFVVLALGLVATAYATAHEPSMGGMGPAAMEGMVASLPPFQLSSAFGHWHVRPWWLLFSWLALASYLSAVLVARRNGVPTVHPVRVMSFVAGIAVLLFTVSSGIDRYAMAIFWDHMIEHLLLIMVVPMFLVLGHPLSAARAAAATYGKEAVVDAFARSWPVALLTHPVVGLGLYSAVLVLTHLTGFMDSMAQHSWLMGFEQWLYVVTGYVYFLPLLGLEPLRWRLPNLLRPALIIVGMSPDTVVGIVLLQADTNMFPIMFGNHPSWAPAPLSDLHVGGALMWVLGDGLMMLFGVGVIIAIISHSRSNQMLGHWLEGVRRNALSEHVRAAGASATLAHDVDVDDDDAVLEAYNQMLARMNRAATPGGSDTGAPPA